MCTTHILYSYILGKHICAQIFGSIISFIDMKDTAFYIEQNTAFSLYVFC
jgi:hypothetical protein